MFGINITTPQFFEFFYLKILLVIFFIELFDCCAKLALVSGEPLLEIFRDNELVWLFHPSVFTELVDSDLTATSEDVGQTVLRVVYLPHHQSAVVFSNFWVQLLGRGQQNVSIKGTQLLQTSVSLVRKAHVELHSQYLGVEGFLDFVNLF